MEIPKDLIDSLKSTKGFDRETFEEVHHRLEQVTSLRVNPAKLPLQNNELVIDAPLANDDIAISLKERVPWTQFGYYLEKRPSFTFDPLFHAGCYYVQEASSMFLEHALRATTDLTKPLRILDLSAAPGGKSTHIQSLISNDSILVSNEVIKSRANILRDNIIKWGTSNVIVTNNDPRNLGKCKSFFDVIVVDAPCSGSGLFRRDVEAIKEWSLANVSLCSQRQQRILVDVWPALKENGILIYSTCSYSKEEDELIAQWIIDELKADYIELDTDPSWNITRSLGLRFWPDKVRGEGFYLACFKKLSGESVSKYKPRKSIERLSKKEAEILSEWVDTKNYDPVKHDNTVYLWPQNLYSDFNILLDQLNIIYSGVKAGELMRDKMVPDHALALSVLQFNKDSATNLTYDQAIQYLQRKEMKLNDLPPGWQRVQYRGHSIGWINVLPNRINNYYPKELRILKDSH